MVSAGLDLDLDESSSVVTAGGSDDQRESSDSASFSIPSLDLSDGLMATGTSLDVEDGSAVDTEAGSPSTEAPGLKDEDAAGAAGETCSQRSCDHRELTAGRFKDSLLLWCLDGHCVLVSTGGAEAAAAPPPVAPESGPSMPAYYLVKWITWKEKKTPIVTQSENGPCPLLAIMNTLFLRWKVRAPFG